MNYNAPHQSEYAKMDKQYWFNHARHHYAQSIELQTEIERLQKKLERKTNLISKMNTAIKKDYKIDEEEKKEQK